MSHQNPQDPSQAFAWVTWIDMKVFSRSTHRIALCFALAGATLVGGCYIVPLQTAPAASMHIPASGFPIAGPLTYSARLYPANDLAAVYGTVTAAVTNDLNGRGYFTTNIHGESFSGEATRVAGSTKDGLANGAGNRGSYINCRYTMNSPTLGTGSCRLANGAVFTMHVGG